MRLATFNVLHGLSPTDGRVDLDRLAEAVRRLDADVLALQEVDRLQARSHRADLTSLVAEAVGAVAAVSVPTLTGRPGRWRPASRSDGTSPQSPQYGIALVSRLPMPAWHVVRLPRRRTAWRSRRRLSLRRDEPRVAVVATVAAPRRTLTVVATHLAAAPGQAAVQLAFLRDRLADVSRPLVLTGDLNLGRTTAVEVSGYTSVADIATFPSRRPMRQLDHVLADGDVRILAPARAVDTGVSDHRALVVDLDC